VIRARLAFALVAASLGSALPARAADPPPANGPVRPGDPLPVTTPVRPGDPPPASQPPLRGDEATLRSGELPPRLERTESANYPPSSARVSVLLGGLAFTAAWWGIGVGTSAAFPDDPGMKDLRTPVAGPWMALSNNRCADDGCSLGDVVRAVWFTVNGIGQAGGLALVLEGVVMRTGGAEAPAAGPLAPRSPLAPSPESSPPPDPNNGKPLFFLPTPMVVGRDGMGVGWGGIF
jgi:hypothetical protein